MSTNNGANQLILHCVQNDTAGLRRFDMQPLFLGTLSAKRRISEAQNQLERNSVWVLLGSLIPNMWNTDLILHHFQNDNGEPYSLRPIPVSCVKRL
jgi:hypothetical protein